MAVGDGWIRDGASGAERRPRSGHLCRGRRELRAALPCPRQRLGDRKRIARALEREQQSEDDQTLAACIRSRILAISSRLGP